ncbi:hypothetical protein MMC25_006659 [Agyrium rufum]|nr:hypothetical protein [Agyrium rufum]
MSSRLSSQPIHQPSRQKTRIALVPYSEVLQALDEAKRSLTPNVTPGYNTAFHSRAEISAALPTLGFHHVSPSQRTQHLSLWLPLIAENQGFSLDDVHVFVLGKLCATAVVDAWSTWRIRGEVTDEVIAGIRDLWPPKTQAGEVWKRIFGVRHDDTEDVKDLSRGEKEVLGHGKAYFPRLDACSAKDGRQWQHGATSLEELIEALITSNRVVSAMREELTWLDVRHEDLEAQERLQDEGNIQNQKSIKGIPRTTPQGKIQSEARKVATEEVDLVVDELLGGIKIFLLPYRKDMDPRREFRVFCPPLSCASDEGYITDQRGSDGMRLRRGVISGILQYRWTSLLDFGKAPYDPAQTIEIVSSALHTICEKIWDRADELEREGKGWLRRKLCEEGFVFDVFLSLDGKDVQLVEINPFGAMSGCGSCLFEWIRDAEQLYGLRNEIVFRVV